LILQGGGGALAFVSGRVVLTLGVRFRHVSNLDRCRNNEGLNSLIGIVGISYFAR